MSWCTIESDPGVFTELVETLGVENVEFRELLTLEASDFEQLGTVHAVVFLFKWRQEDYTQEAIASTGGELDFSESIFFAKQTVNNACATQAIINALLNSSTVSSIGPTLTDFQGFAGALPAVGAECLDIARLRRLSLLCLHLPVTRQRSLIPAVALLPCVDRIFVATASETMK